MKLIFKLIILIMIPVTLIILLLSVDDDIEPEAVKVYQKVTEHKESEAYTYLLGIYAAIDEDPLIVGKEQLKSLRNEEERIADKSIEEQQYNIHKYPKAKRLTLFKLKSCKTLQSKNDCNYIDRLIAQNYHSENITNSESVLLARYQEYLGKDDFHTLALPNMMSPMPSYTYLLAGNNLTHLIAFDHAEKKRESEAITTLLNNLKLLRNHLQQADNLVMKAIFTRAISDNLDVLSVIIHKHNIVFNKIIPALNDLERSLEKPLAYEFAGAYQFSNDYQRISQSDNKKANHKLGEILTKRFLYKPNMQINVAYPRYERVIKLSKGSSKEFTDFVENEPPLKFEKSFLRNYVGDVMNQIAFPDYSKYVASVFYLDAKIQLFNETSNVKRLPANPASIENPFYDNDASGVYLKNDNRLCFKVPKETRSSDHCLRA